MDIKRLVSIKIKRIERNTIFFTAKTRIWCKLPYPNHPHGCPNYGKNPNCPPNTEIMENILTRYNFFYLIYAIFEIEKYKDAMLKKHPNWSERQALCLLYWQGTIKKMLKDFIKKIYRLNPNNSFYLFSSGSGYKDPIFNQNKIISMEAGGINVIKTLKKNNIPIEIKPKNKIILVNLICSKNKISFT